MCDFCDDYSGRNYFCDHLVRALPTAVLEQRNECGAVCSPCVNLAFSEYNKIMVEPAPLVTCTFCQRERTCYFSDSSNRIDGSMVTSAISLCASCFTISRARAQKTCHAVSCAVCARLVGETCSSDNQLLIGWCRKVLVLPGYQTMIGARVCYDCQSNAQRLCPGEMEALIKPFDCEDAVALPEIFEEEVIEEGVLPDVLSDSLFDALPDSLPSPPLKDSTGKLYIPPAPVVQPPAPVVQPPVQPPTPVTTTPPFPSPPVVIHLPQCIICYGYNNLTCTLNSRPFNGRIIYAGEHICWQCINTTVTTSVISTTTVSTMNNIRLPQLPSAAPAKQPPKRRAPLPTVTSYLVDALRNPGPPGLFAIKRPFNSGESDPSGRTAVVPNPPDSTSLPSNARKSERQTPLQTSPGVLEVRHEGWRSTVDQSRRRGATREELRASNSSSQLQQAATRVLSTLALSTDGDNRSFDSRDSRSEERSDSHHVTFADSDPLGETATQSDEETIFEPGLLEPRPPGLADGTRPRCDHCWLPYNLANYNRSCYLEGYRYHHKYILCSECAKYREPCVVCGNKIDTSHRREDSIVLGEIVYAGELICKKCSNKQKKLDDQAKRFNKRAELHATPKVPTSRQLDLLKPLPANPAPAEY